MGSIFELCLASIIMVDPIAASSLAFVRVGARSSLVRAWISMVGLRIVKMPRHRPSLESETSLEAIVIIRWAVGTAGMRLCRVEQDLMEIIGEGVSNCERGIWTCCYE